MIVISYLWMYIYTHIYECIQIYTHIYVYRSIYFLSMSMKRWRGLVVPMMSEFRRPHWAAGRVSQPDGIQVLLIFSLCESVTGGQRWPIAVFLTPQPLSHPLALLFVGELLRSSASLSASRDTKTAVVPSMQSEKWYTVHLTCTAR